MKDCRSPQHAEALDADLGRGPGTRRLVVGGIVEIRHRVEFRIEVGDVRVGEQRLIVELPPLARFEEEGGPEPSAANKLWTSGARFTR